jgi:hypothetical protein
VKLDSFIKGTTWGDVFAGNVYLEHGYLWLLDYKGKLFYTKPQKGEMKLKPADLPCSSKIVCITPAPDALWVLNSEGVVYGRCDVSSTNPAGFGWDRIDLSTLGIFNGRF